MKKHIILSTTSFLFLLNLLFAQSNSITSNDNEELTLKFLQSYKTVNKTEVSEIAEIVLDDFEVNEIWTSSIPSDLGILLEASHRDAPASFTQKDPNNKKVLGVKVRLTRRYYSWMTLLPPTPKPIHGIAKRLKVLVTGRNKTHHLKALLRDVNGTIHEISFGKLTFPGWNELIGFIPKNVEQTDERRIFMEVGSQRVDFLSFLIQFEPSTINTQEDYYIYFDNLKAESDIFIDKKVLNDKNIMKDNW